MKRISGRLFYIWRCPLKAIFRWVLLRLCNQQRTPVEVMNDLLFTGFQATLMMMFGFGLGLLTMLFAFPEAIRLSYPAIFQQVREVAVFLIPKTSEFVMEELRRIVLYFLAAVVVLNLMVVAAIVRSNLQAGRKWNYRDGFYDRFFS